jgi:hypothetical protein
MRVLIACECSGRVREAFTALGHDAWSCDLQPTELPGKHFQEDVLKVIHYGWDLMIAHPPCTYLAVSSVGHLNFRGLVEFPIRAQNRDKAIAFVRALMDAPIPRICIENPISMISSLIRKPDQIIQPWQFGHGEKKATCLWLKGLPLLKPTKIVPGRVQRILAMSPSKTRQRDRSRTYPGIARAMAEQWGTL